MGRNIRLRELLVGVEGLALLRNLYDGTDEAADRRLAEVRRLLDDDAFSTGESTAETDPRSGYRSWSERYDQPGNPIIATEEPVVWSILDALPPGRALDAACGTGRHARHLAERGHEVLGIDLSPEMLSRAAAKVPGAEFAEGDLRRIPAQAEHFDLVVCALAIAHLPDIRAGVAELARVLRPKGRLVISVLHPFQALLGWQAPFADASGRRAFVREHIHTHADYLAAFRATELRVRNCLEPELTADEVRAKRRAFRHLPEATAQAYLGLPSVLVWDLEKGERHG
jgi:ubiquinone/menaquinone biosynthesis C-methylase UbiE